jgi:GTP cyclohydrolase II
MIKLLKIRSVALLTNNPDKIEQLTAEGIQVVDRIPIVIPANRHDQGYLDVKRQKMRHML